MASIKAPCFILLVFLCLIGVLYFTIFTSASEASAHYSIQISHAQNNKTERIKPPALPDISEYSVQNIRRRVPALSQEAQIVIRKMKDVRGFLPTHSLHEHYADRQERLDAKVILVKAGVVDIAAVHKAVGDRDYIIRHDKGYLLKVPLYIQSGAALVVQGEKQALRLSQQPGVFIASRGDLYIVDTNITGWQVAQNKPARFTNRDHFRPFLVFWDGSKTYIAGSRLTHLGYSAAKAYGLTFSTNGAFVKENPDSPWPKGWLVENEFNDLYYGFYSHEAKDIAIIGNTYKDNIVYAIDPHDRSHNLIIANNETTGTKIKHGIIASRSVHNSWIFNNRSHGNAGAGIMLERSSTHNVVAHNEVYNNEDGISFYESGHNISWGNIVKDNRKNGFRIRNSQNIKLGGECMLGNGGYGLDVYSADLSDHKRNLALDPYEQNTSFNIEHSEFDQNMSGQIRVQNVTSARFTNIKAFRPGSAFITGDLHSENLKLYSAMTDPASTVVIEHKTISP